MDAQGIDVDQALVVGASMYYQLSMYIPVTALGFYYPEHNGNDKSGDRYAGCRGA